MKTRQVFLKTILWAIMGVLAVVTVVRFTRGLGATTGLSDAAPWGLWIAFDVVAGVALASGGFLVAGAVYIFGREQYRPFVRPAILTAFLGYVAVVVGLLYDLGLPWNIWRPILHQQHHSVLFEVAMCVMLYLTVLLLEFAPVILEHPWFDRPLFRGIHRLLKGATIPLVVAGIVLSTLHQSSLGSLFLLTPHRLHPLWYSPILWILFFISAAGLGLMVVAAESLFSAWLFGHKVRLDLLSGLGRAASIVLFGYAGLRLGDLAARGAMGALWDGSWQSILFLIELSASALIPAALLSFRRVRSSAAGLAACAGMTILGVIGYRFDVCLVAFTRPEGMSYVPTWMEAAVSLGIVAGGMLAFLFFVERLRVYPEEEGGPSEEASPTAGRPDFAPTGTRLLLPGSLSETRRYSLAAVIGAAAAAACLPGAILSGRQLPTTPASAPRTLDGWMQTRAGGPAHRFFVTPPDAPPPVGAERVPLLMLDGNRDRQLVLFPHQRHIGILGGQGSCRACHHQSMPFDKNSSCFECHRDMYAATDLFDHRNHVEKLKGNDGCVRCHTDPGEVKNRDTALACVECHADMLAEGSAVRAPEEGVRGLAPGYMDAMHGLCIGCHQRWSKQPGADVSAEFAECSTCHQDVDAVPFEQMKPYPRK